MDPITRRQTGSYRIITNFPHITELHECLLAFIWP